MAELAHRARRPVTLRHSGILFKPNVKQTIAVHTDSPSGSGLMSLTSSSGLVPRRKPGNRA
jgi:hypothetical protein